MVLTWIMIMISDQEVYKLICVMSNLVCFKDVKIHVHVYTYVAFPETTAANQPNNIPTTGG